MPKHEKQTAHATRVRVRMYRQGLGDCFLLTFDPGGSEKHVLIDCGTLGTKRTTVKMKDVIANIDETTKGHLHLVVGTHEHQDHLSGFPALQKQFRQKNKSVDKVWLAWTEKPGDKAAERLMKARADMGAALTAAAQALRARGDEEAQNCGLAVESLLGFFNQGEDGQEPLGPATEFGAASKSSMDSLRGLTKSKKDVEYLHPGDGPIEEPWLEDFRFYVLGPPTEIDRIHDVGEHGSSEIYGLRGFRAAASLCARQGDGDTAAIAAAEAEHEAPFDWRFRSDEKDEAIQTAFCDSYFEKAEAWRRVDLDWLQAASDLALKLDTYTNNTSVVLALERKSDGKVLLFPADAQEGNWLSWHDAKIQWKVTGPDGASKTVRAKDLLARTVFYKVGHHSSHNATAKAEGLEMMEQEELIAFIPVDRQVALNRTPKNTWQMPARQLYRRLLEKCQGRVMRSDLGWAADEKDDAVEAQLKGIASSAEWAQWKTSQDAAVAGSVIDIQDEYVDFLLE